MKFKLEATIVMSKEITFEAESIEEGLKKMRELEEQPITPEGMEVKKCYYSHNPSQFVDIEELRRRVAEAEKVPKGLEIS